MFLLDIRQRVNHIDMQHIDLRFEPTRDYSAGKIYSNSEAKTSKLLENIRLLIAVSGI